MLTPWWIPASEIQHLKKGVQRDPLMKMFVFYPRNLLSDLQTYIVAAFPSFVLILIELYFWEARRAITTTAGMTKEKIRNINSPVIIIYNMRA